MQSTGRTSMTMFFIGSGVLLFEVLLTRLLAIALFANLAFAAIAVALFGMAIGGWIASKHDELEEVEKLKRIRLALIFAAIFTVAACLLLAFFPLVPETVVDGAKKASTWSTRWRAIRHNPLQLNLFTILISLIVQAVPFCCASYAQALILSARTRIAGRLYAADLIGACIGAWSALFLLPLFGAENAVFVATLLFVLSGLSTPVKTSFLLKAVMVGIVAASFLGLVFHPLAIQHSAGFSEKRVVDTEWSALARVSLYDTGSRNVPAVAKNTPDELVSPTLLVDNSSRSKVAFLGDERFSRDLDMLPLSLRPDGRVLIIGAGGGQEIVNAAATTKPGTIRHVDAVEVAPGIPPLMRKHFGNRPDFVLDYPGLNYLIADGRSFLEMSRERWSVIQMKEVNFHSLAGQASASWSPSLLFTLEAFQTFIEHLSEDGFFSMIKFYGGNSNIAYFHTLITIREAIENLGMDLAPRLLLVERKYSYGRRRLILVARNPISNADIRFAETLAEKNEWKINTQPGKPF